MNFTEHDKLIKEWMAEEAEQHKKDMCQSWCHSVNPATGEQSKRTLDCAQFRICEHCNEKMVLAYFDKFLPFWSEGDLFVSLVDEAAWKSTSRRWRRANIEYRQWPQDGYRFCVTSQQIGNEGKVDPSFFVPLTEDEWTSEPNCDKLGNILRMVPKGKRSGGRLGRGTSVKVDREGQEAVKVETIQHDKDWDVDERAWGMAVERTEELNPVNVVEVEVACEIRAREYKKALKELGARITSTRWETRYVRLVSISWNGSIGNKRTSPTAVQQDFLKLVAKKELDKYLEVNIGLRFRSKFVREGWGVGGLRQVDEYSHKVPI